LKFTIYANSSGRLIINNVLKIYLSFLCLLSFYWNDVLWVEHDGNCIVGYVKVGI